MARERRESLRIGIAERDRHAQIPKQPHSLNLNFRVN